MQENPRVGLIILDIMFFRIFDNLIPSSLTVRKMLKLTGTHLDSKMTFDSSLKLSTSEVKINRSFEDDSIQNTYTLLGRCRGNETIDLAIADGINNDLINCDGSFEPSLYRDTFLKHAVKRDELQDVYTWLKNNQACMNSVSLLYNLLRLYYIEELGDIEYSPESKFFSRDGKVVNNGQIYSEYETKCKLRSSVSIKPAKVDVDSEAHLNRMMEYPAYIWDSTFTTKHEQILADAAGSWRSRAPFQIAHPSKTLADYIVINTGHKQEKPILDNRELTNKSHIFDVIQILVESNLLYTDFDYAYAMISQVLVQYVPNKVDNLVFPMMMRNVNMPRLQSISGYIPMAYSGVPFARRSTWQDTFSRWLVLPNAAVLHSVAVNEYVNMQASNINITKISAGESEKQRQKIMASYIDGKPMAIDGIIYDMLSIAAMGNYKIDMPYAMYCGLSRKHDIRTVEKLSIEVIRDDKVIKCDVKRNAKIDIKSVMTFGLMPTGLNFDERSTTIKSSVAHTPKGDIIFKRVDDFVNYMKIMAYCSYNVKAYSMFNMTQYTNYASDVNYVTSILDISDEEIEDCFVVKADAVTKQRKSKFMIDTNASEIELNITVDSMQVTVVNTNDDALYKGSAVSKMEHINTTKVESKIAINSATLIPMRLNPNSDFRFVTMIQLNTKQAAPPSLLQKEKYDALGKEMEQVDDG